MKLTSILSLKWSREERTKKPAMNADISTLVCSNMKRRLGGKKYNKVIALKKILNTFTKYYSG